MKANGGYLIYMEDEVKKLIRAFQEKYNDPGCDGLPYEPNGILVKFLVRAPKKHQPKKSRSEFRENDLNNRPGTLEGSEICSRK